MQEMDSRNQNFPGRGMPQTPLDGHTYGAWCTFGTWRAYGTVSPPPYKSLDPPLSTLAIMVLARNEIEQCEFKTATKKTCI